MAPDMHEPIQPLVFTSIHGVLVGLGEWEFRLSAGWTSRLHYFLLHEMQNISML